MALTHIGTPVLLREIERRCEAIKSPVHRARMRHLIAMCRRDLIGEVTRVLDKLAPRIKGWKRPGWNPEETERLSRKAAGEPQGA